MVEIPKDIDEAVAQAQEATKAALNDGYHRLQVELVIPELKVQPIAEKFIPLFESYGERLKVYFPDAGAAALARRDWGETPYVVRGMMEPKGKIQPEDEVFLFVEPSSVEVSDLEKMCVEAGDRPVVLLLPKLENIATIGIGYAGRQLQERFLKTLESCYYIRPAESFVLFRCYPSPWQVWMETDGNYQLISETESKPVGDALEQIVAKALGIAPTQPEAPAKRQGWFSGMKSFLRALNQ
jgi:hypothetical protein